VKQTKTQRLWHESCKHLAGGVNSPVRAFNGVGGVPVFAKKGKGKWLWDEDSNRYLDFSASWGPLILGQLPSQVVSALKSQMTRGLTFGMPTELEISLAQEVKKAFPAIERVRMVSSGTEATMSAIRLARGVTGRDMIVKFSGCYHGHADGLLVAAGSGLATLGTPSSKGVPSAYVKETLVLPYNNFQALDKVFKKYKKRIAGIILEPIAGNMGVVPPVLGFLKYLCQSFWLHFLPGIYL